MRGLRCVEGKNVKNHDQQLRRGMGMGQRKGISKLIRKCADM